MDTNFEMIAINNLTDQMSGEVLRLYKSADFAHNSIFSLCVCAGGVMEATALGKNLFLNLVVWVFLTKKMWKMKTLLMHKEPK